jgi:hypothetical protein
MAIGEKPRGEALDQARIEQEQVRQLIEVTRKGPVTQWIERMAVVAGNLGLRLENINWNGSPAMVAQEVVVQARLWGG